jgi:NitT/TauT family transport system substrate-binding protein
MLGAAGGLRLAPAVAHAEPPPETTRLRLFKFPATCLAPQYLAEELLAAEGFTDVQYLEFPEGAQGVFARIGSGAVDMSQWYLPPAIVEIDKGVPITLVAGVHAGCWELFASERVRTLRDLKGKTVGVPWLGPGPFNFLIATMLVHVGLHPQRDVTFVALSVDESARQLALGQIDAFMAAPPAAQALRAKGVGRIILNSAVDRPWSQYLCCSIAANREFVRAHPVATKRAIRAILKAEQLCARDPERAARGVADRGLTSYEHARQMMRDVPYGRWRQYDPADTVRFYALRLREAGAIKSTPQTILAQGTDWRFHHELKRELKG